MPGDRGKVYLIGAGPGDQGLLTVKGAEILGKADVVVYDRLVGDEILLKIPDRAEKINVGKNAGSHPVPQEEINKILLNKALEGKVVVRLKGGDPFVFGRGGEELELLSEHDMPFEVVPGVTSAIAAAAYAGIPVTHRDLCSSLHIITGHAKKDSPLNIDYTSLVKLGGTLVFMMSVSSIPDIAKGLIDAGMDPCTKAAVVENGTRPDQRKYVDNLSNIVSVIEKNNVKSPAAIVIGRVCELADRYDWFSKLPLKGCNVLITRPKQTAGKLSTMLGELGAGVTEYPCIKTCELDFELDIESFSWLVFTSAVGVKVFFSKLFEKGLDSRCLYGKKVAAVGTETAVELMNYGIHADFIPGVFDGKHLAEELLSNGQVLLTDNVGVFRARNGSEDIIHIFNNNHIAVSDIHVYKTDYIKNDRIDVNRYDYVAFTSASCVDGFAGSFGNTADYAKIKAVCIGEKTASAAKRYGMNTIISDNSTISGMAAKILELYQGIKKEDII